MGRALPIHAMNLRPLRSGAENLAAATTAGGQHTAAVLGGHAGTETMHLAALTLLGLVGTEHL